jgi:hypothetical protein
MTVLQVSALQFLAPFAIAFAQGRLFLTWILLVNTMVSLVVHRPKRSAGRETIDDVDNAAVAAWALANAMVVVEDPWRPNVWFAGVCAAMVGGFAWLRLKLDKRGYRRIVIHVLMHTAGAAGTSVLLA